ncbi:MAG: 4Fe-4S binding protein [Candidatus Marinimicrobia bacterium]|nr:4Fe-4S binding protein [Candidatus Neomarinimicrobiota bacterium]
MTKNGVKISLEKGLQNQIRDFLKKSLEKGVFDAVILPVRVPTGDSYAWILMNDPSLIDQANPVPPVMPVQGAKALKALTRKGNGIISVATIMRSCEIRAAMELSKLNQVNLDKITLISYDCPGAVPMRDYNKVPNEIEKVFQDVLSEKNFESEKMKEVCGMCVDFSNSPADLHFGFAGSENEAIIIPNSEKGQSVLNKLKIECSENLSQWEKTISEIRENKSKNRVEIYKSVQPTVEGLDNLQATFIKCISCHNCQSVCPICYCRQCYFDSGTSKQAADYLQYKAETRGGIGFPRDKIMFQVGRMSHMSLSCVSCGQCMDACPVDIPVAKIFSYVAAKTQDTFEYHAGDAAGEAIPLKVYKQDELNKIHELVKNAEPHGSQHE